MIISYKCIVASLRWLCLILRKHHAIAGNFLFITNCVILGHIIILLIWLPMANDDVYSAFRELPQIYPIVSSFFYITLCGEQDGGPTTSRY